MRADEILRGLLRQDEGLGLSHDNEYGTCYCMHCDVEVGQGPYLMGRQFPHAEGCLIAAAWEWFKGERGTQDEN